MEEKNQSRLSLFIYTIVYSIAKKWRQVVSLTLVGLVFGIVISSAKLIAHQNMSYRIEGSFNVTTQTSNGNYTSNTKIPNGQDVQLSPSITSSVIYAMESKDILRESLSTAGISDMNATQLKKQIQMNQYGKTSIVTYSFMCNDAKEGVVLAKALLTVAQKRLPGMLTVGNVTQVEAPTYTYERDTLNTLKWLFVLTAVGLLIGVTSAVLERFMKPTLLNIDDVTYLYNQEVIGVIPRDRHYFKLAQPFLNTDTNAPADQGFETASFVLRNMLSSEKSNIFYVTSSSRKEGRSSVSAGLATHLAGMEKKVLLVDLDVKVPMLGGLFLPHVSYEHSLNALYHGDATLSQAITSINGYLDILPSLAQSKMIHYDQRLFDLIKKASQNYDYIVVDTAPVGISSGVLNLNRITQNVLFVMGYDMVSLGHIQHAITKLEKSGIPILGVIVNGAMNLKSVFEKDTARDDTSVYKQMSEAVKDITAEEEGPHEDQAWKSLDMEDLEADQDKQAKADEHFGMKEDDDHDS